MGEKKESIQKICELTLNEYLTNQGKSPQPEEEVF